MPTYEYVCKTNGHRFEVRQSFSDDALTECEVCGEPVRKVFTAAGIVFKGSGYYVTDTRKTDDTRKKDKTSDSSSSTTSASGSSGATSADQSTSSSSESTSSASSTSTRSGPDS